ncbi:UpxY family transcription antiterminator [uncultured Roseivirga sp.]|uniref:UpxY family transcription antiterminator n=1 Tax=uncultured Roseivirga sp. TaxID=543088 RepID=UPI0030DD737F|tara:strand:+ start:4022 stop:4528 length:507 start_codon:yes stop_codon:yes gene_type:complete
MNNPNRTYWTAFYTKPRNERKAAERLTAKGFDVYCPTRTVLKQWSDRKKKVIEPVFNSYLFAKVDEACRLEILKDSSIVSNVRWLGKPAIIQDKEILEIRSFLEEFPLLELVHEDFQVGSRVNVGSGPLSGQSGVIRKTQGNRVSLLISSLGVELQAEIGMNHLRKVS